MKYKAPFYGLTKAFYATFNNNPLVLFDSSVPPENVEAYFEGQGSYCYGVMGEVSGDCVSAESETIIWQANMTLEIYSNYKGKKTIAEKLEAVLNNIETDFDTFQTALVQEGFGLIAIQCNDMRINNPVFGETGTWQSGVMDITFKMGQLEETPPEPNENE